MTKVVYFENLFPIGYVYISVVDTNPSTYFGGTWEKIAQGKTLVGVDTSDSDFNTVGKIGGSKYIQDHKHRDIWVAGNYLTAWNDSTGSSGKFTMDNLFSSTGRGSTKDNFFTTGAVADGTTTGNSGNLQPYFTVYMWQRTA